MKLYCYNKNIVYHEMIQTTQEFRRVYTPSQHNEILLHLARTKKKKKDEREVRMCVWNLKKPGCINANTSR
jgi:hypothetical protein